MNLIMSKKGFYIKSIIATGEGMIDSKVQFTDGCNLLFGPSERGQSSVFSIINYMLGATEIPKKVKESFGYTDYYMEFVTYQDNLLHTAHRGIKDNTVVIKDCSFEQFNNPLNKATKYPITARKPDIITYSRYLMNLNGFASLLQMKKSKTSKANLAFSYVRHMFLVSEGRVVADKPIFIPINDTATATQEKSFLYYLTSGKDDSDFQESEKEEIRKTRIEGQLAFAQNNLDEINQRIISLGDVSFADLKGDVLFEANKKQISEQEEVLKTLYKERCCKEDELKQLKSKLLFANEFVKRMTLLQKHYLLDLQRYEHLFEGYSLLIPLPKEYTCPICHSHFANSTEICDEYKDLVSAEFMQTQAKLTDVGKVIKDKEKEIDNLQNQVLLLDRSISDIIAKIHSFEPQIDELKKALLKYKENVEKKVYANFLQAEALRFSKLIDNLQIKLKSKPNIPEYSRQATIDDDFCNSVKSKLQAWNVIGNVPVFYEDKEFDFNIGGQKRTMCGKGTRGVTCTAIIMTLIEYCKKKGIPFSELLVVDSPLTAHFDDEHVDADQTTQARFFKYCNEHDFDYQLILIDNKAPDALKRSSMEGINFIEFSDLGRKGFYLGKREKTE